MIILDGDAAAFTRDRPTYPLLTKTHANTKLAKNRFASNENTFLKRTSLLIRAWSA